MRTLEYMINKAVQIAEANSEARIGVICDWQDVPEAISRIGCTGVLRYQTREFQCGSGAVIKFLQLRTLDSTVQQLAGAQFSHVFNFDVTDYSIINFVRSRVRCASVLTEPVGYYDRFGVQRYEDY